MFFLDVVVNPIPLLAPLALPIMAISAIVLIIALILIFKNH